MNEINHLFQQVWDSENERYVPDQQEVLAWYLTATAADDIMEPIAPETPEDRKD